MSKKLKYIISVSLVFILLTPMTIKLIDSTFHHHDYFSCAGKNVKHFHQYHETCPISGIELSLYSLNKIIDVTQKIIHGDHLIINYISTYFYCQSKYSFLLRAPPLSIHY